MSAAPRDILECCCGRPPAPSPTMRYDSSEWVFVVREKFPSGMTGEMRFWLPQNFYRMPKGCFIEASFVVYHKRKQAWRDSEDGYGLNITTGRDGAYSLRWALRQLEAFEDLLAHYMRPHSESVKILVEGSDHRRRKLYHKVLFPRGYRTIDTPDGAALSKEISYKGNDSLYCYANGPSLW